MFNQRKVIDMKKLLTILLVFLSVATVSAMELIVTDSDGVKHEMKGAGYGGHGPYEIELTLEEKPQEWLSINSHYIKKAVFKKAFFSKKVYVTVYMKDNSKYKGISTQQDDMIWDKYDKTGAESQLSFSQIKEIVFVKTNKQRDYSAVDNSPVITWEIIDGNTTITGTKPVIIDHYMTDRKGNKIYKNELFRKAIWKLSLVDGVFNLSTGKFRVILNVSKIDEIEITGKLLNKQPEVVITFKDGSTQTLSMGMYKDIKHNQDSTYGDFDIDDYYCWNEENFGRKAISLQPLRRIVIRKK